MVESKRPSHEGLLLKQGAEVRCPQQYLLVSNRDLWRHFLHDVTVSLVGRRCCVENVAIESINQVDLRCLPYEYCNQS